MPLAAIALGSNLGDRESTLSHAAESLARLGRVVAVSPWLQTAPVGYANQPDFLNGAVVLETQQPPDELLQALLQIERNHGRDRSHGIEKGPRTLDLDLLLYDDLVIITPELTVPHPEMHTRRFVLEPLAAIAPDMVHPVLQKTAAELLAQL
ncbi:MAG: 2-amino-4-hydroxy-6-hydroxymethyldihydropteridine diphosphokinase [Terriglobus sp.]